MTWQHHKMWLGVRRVENGLEGWAVLLPVLGVKLRSVSDDEDWRLHGLKGEKGGGEEEEVGRDLKGVGGPEDKGRSSPNTGLPGEHDTHTHVNHRLTL